jgi:hypothetical protein
VQWRDWPWRLRRRPLARLRAQVDRLNRRVPPGPPGLLPGSDTDTEWDLYGPGPDDE